MARTYHFVVGQAEAGGRLDRYLARHLPATISRAVIQRGIRGSAITVGERQVKVSYRLRQGEVVTALFTQLPARSQGIELLPEAIPLTIVYEDAELLVVEKPAGLVTHPAPGHWQGTLVNALLWHFQQQVQGSGFKVQGNCLEPRTYNLEQGLPRAGIVHRLDKDTSGLLLVAKTTQAHTVLSRQLKARAVKRHYLALVEGHMPLDAGAIHAPLGRHLVHRKEMTVRHLGGRAAVTHYRVLKRLAAQGSRFNQPRTSNLEPGTLPYTVLDVSLETGRTHQIRVHLAHLGYPVLGDPTYGRRPASFWRSLGIERHLLHAYRLSFRHPGTGTPMTVTAQIPEDLRRWAGPEAIEIGSR